MLLFMSTNLALNRAVGSDCCMKKNLDASSKLPLTGGSLHCSLWRSTDECDYKASSMAVLTGYDSDLGLDDLGELISAGQDNIDLFDLKSVAAVAVKPVCVICKKNSLEDLFSLTCGHHCHLDCLDDAHPGCDVCKSILIKESGIVTHVPSWVARRPRK